MPYITHPNGQITHYLVDDFTDPWKPKETILIQHGYCRSADHWYKWVPVLSQKYRVIRRDARSHGRSSTPKPSDPPYEYNADTLLLEIVDLLDQLNIERVHYIGESTGGMWGEALAAKFPQRLLSLTVMSTPMYIPPSGVKATAFGYASFPEAVRQLGARQWSASCAKLIGTDKGSDPAYLEWWLDLCGRPEADGLAQHAELILTLDCTHWVDAIKCPTLILAPLKSPMIWLDGEGGQRELHSRVKGSRLVVIENEGHEIYLDKAERCQKEVLSFLASVSQPS